MVPGEAARARGRPPACRWGRPAAPSRWPLAGALLQPRRCRAPRKSWAAAAAAVPGLARRWETSLGRGAGRARGRPGAPAGAARAWHGLRRAAGEGRRAAWRGAGGRAGVPGRAGGGGGAAGLPPSRDAGEEGEADGEAERARADARSVAAARRALTFSSLLRPEPATPPQPRLRRRRRSPSAKGEADADAAPSRPGARHRIPFRSLAKKEFPAVVTPKDPPRLASRRPRPLRLAASLEGYSPRASAGSGPGSSSSPAPQFSPVAAARDFPPFFLTGCRVEGSGKGASSSRIKQGLP